ncbi:MAG: Ig-like domain-containing protein, partial [Oscillospiraceae bacterium]|nr:Ig-like domain-containing protein [Oscillospiraceae bacterium]
MVGQFPTDESATINEISFVAPPNSTGMVFAFVRESGEVLKSMDYGMTWEHFGNQDRTIHQPGFQVIDNDRVYVTWARSWARPRFVYGKVMYVNGSYDDTGYELVYQPPVNAGQDMGDPSSTLMADGNMLVVCYDAYYRSIVGTVVEVDSTANIPVELSPDAGKATLYEQTFQDKALSSTPVTAQGSFGSSYTVEADFTLAAGGSVSVAGAAVTASKITVGGKSASVSLAADTVTHLKASFVGTALYVKVWQGDKEPASWTLTGSSTPGTVAVTGSSAALKVLRVTHRVAITMADTMSVTTVTAPTKLDLAINPLQSSVTWASSDPAVASVSGDGTITFHKVGTVDITVNAGGVKKSCTITVSEPPAEMSGKGEKVTVHVDDFQSYSDGSLWNQMKQNGYNTSTTGEEGNASTIVLGSDGSNKFLTLDGKSSWIRVNKPMTGNYTVQFDFNFGGAGTLYATLNQGKGDTYDTRAFIHIVKGGKTGSGTRFQYDDESGQAANYPNDPVMHGGLEGLSDFAANQWYTIKLVRAGEGLYMKLWQKGQAEPDSWSQFLSLPAFDTLKTANQNTFFRLQWATAAKMHIDNITVTQQQGKGADFMLDVPTGAWYYSAVDYAIK